MKYNIKKYKLLEKNKENKFLELIMNEIILSFKHTNKLNDTIIINYNTS